MLSNSQKKKNFLWDKNFCDYDVELPLIFKHEYTIHIHSVPKLSHLLIYNLQKLLTESKLLTKVFKIGSMPGCIGGSYDKKYNKNAVFKWSSKQKSKIKTLLLHAVNRFLHLNVHITYCWASGMKNIVSLTIPFLVLKTKFSNAILKKVLILKKQDFKKIFWVIFK